MAYSTINKSTDFFNTVLYTGNDQNSRAVTGVGFQPDWAWLKNRSLTYSHQTFDAVRGATDGALYTDLTNAVDTSYPISSFDSDGITLRATSHVSQNGNNDNFVLWNWKAGTTSGLSGGTITPSAYSINTTAGFGIYKYSGNGYAGATIAHGLGAKPHLILVKILNTTDNWCGYHKSLGAHYKAASLDSNTTSHDHPDYFNDTEPTSSVFSLGGGDNGNNSGEKNIAYCFTDIKGFAKHGSFIGNGSSDGPFIHTGFKPALIIGKNTSRSDDWFMLDNKRDTFNPVDQRLQPNSSGTESTVTSLGIDFCANGFKLKGATNQYNPSGETMIYMAFAESPFVNSNGVPTNAR